MNSVLIRKFVRASRLFAQSVVLAAVLAGSIGIPLTTQAQPAGQAAQERNAEGPLRGMQQGDETKAANDRRLSSPSSGNPDIDFAQAMRRHHQEAMQMAEAELKNGKDTSMRKLARDVLNAQRRQIVRIDRFLAEKDLQAKKS